MPPSACPAPRGRVRGKGRRLRLRMATSLLYFMQHSQQAKHHVRAFSCRTLHRSGVCHWPLHHQLGDRRRAVLRQRPDRRRVVRRLDQHFAPAVVLDLVFARPNGGLATFANVSSARRRGKPFTKAIQTCLVELCEKTFLKRSRVLAKYTKAIPIALSLGALAADFSTYFSPGAAMPGCRVTKLSKTCSWQANSTQSKEIAAIGADRC